MGLFVHPRRATTASMPTHGRAARKTQNDTSTTKRRGKRQEERLGCNRAAARTLCRCPTASRPLQAGATNQSSERLKSSKLEYLTRQTLAYMVASCWSFRGYCGPLDQERPSW